MEMLSKSGFLLLLSSNFFTFGLINKTPMLHTRCVPLILGMVVLSAVLVIFSSACIAMQQPTDHGEDASGVQAGAGVELVSRYQWRGMVLSPGPAIQPYVDITSGRFSAGLWGSSTLQAFAWQETDVYLSYTHNQWKVSLIDYFYHDVSVEEPTFFNYRKGTTGHVIEAVAEFTGNSKLPFRALAGYNVYGADTSHASYIELAWMKTLGETGIELFAGFTPNAGYYHETKKGVTNVGVSMLRTLWGNDQLNIPLKITAVYNPLTQQMLLVAGLGLF